MQLTNKWVVKYMKMAKALADDNKACYSRKIGVVLMSEDNEPIGFGYNGSISGAPHNDEGSYLAHLWKNLLDDKQKEYLVSKYNLKPCLDKEGNEVKIFVLGEDEVDSTGRAFVDKFTDCKTCPRKLLDLKPGELLELCNCSHAERNAIFNAAKRGASTKHSHMFCWCAVPCHECSIAIVQSGVKKVYCLHSDLPDYSRSSRFNLLKGGVELIQVREEEVLAAN